MYNKKLKYKVFSIFTAAILTLTAVAPVYAEEENLEAEAISGESDADASADQTAPDITGLTYESTMDLSFAECFDVYYYKDGYKLLDVHDSARYLLVPEGKEAPEGLDDDIQVLQQPLDTIYMAATSPMALFDAIGSVDSIKLSGLDASGWYIQSAADAINNGDMTFAGKYDEPDYELLVGEDCDLAIESTMILHAPKVQEMIETLGIPVFIDRSSYESQPLGRTEWIKLYGAMMNKEEEANAFFDQQSQIIEKLKDFTNTEKTVAFFYINTSGAPVVRNPKDYISSMIEVAGGRNAFADLQDDSGKTSVSITMEEFYNTAVDADYLIYNSSIDATVKSLDDLLAKDSLMADFKAVKEGNVWVTDDSMYQHTDTIGELINDFNLMLTGGSEEDMTFLHKLG
ncbi:MAG: ABC transporter substrate-binding protein [Clostridia bacterium]|nr:ABC transporter substrate-binding protein [Clostridia bacterium]